MSNYRQKGNRCHLQYISGTPTAGNFYFFYRIVYSVFLKYNKNRQITDKKTAKNRENHVTNVYF